MVQPSGEQQSCSTDPALVSRARDVGAEFVYFYYMSVNKCPQDLHRFYSSTSLFVHGGREAPGQEQPPACGQAAIAERIANLKLLDCRTKILMVDSMPDSTGEGVLIQVCGEISNNAGPMRRFMQTFLLAPSGPKKYFVQRDIFRYQDEVFTDTDTSSVSDAAMETTTTADLAADADASAAPVPMAAGTATSPPPPAAVSADEPPGLASPMASASAAANGDGSMVAVDDSALTAAAEQQEESAFAAADAVAPDASTVPKEIPAPIVSGGGGGSGGAASGVRRNFAALFGGGSAPAPPAAAPPPQPQQQQAAPRRPTAAAPPVSTNGQPKPEVQQWGPEQDVPDNQQVFVGNIGPDMTEADLMEEFSKYGPVVSCRINSNRNRPSGSAGFGFVSFADPDTVRQLIEMRRIVTEYGTTLNLEEKKSSGRRGGGGGGGFGGRGGGGGSFGRGARGSSRR